MYDTCVNDEQNSSRRGGIVVYTDVENAWDNLDQEGANFSPPGVKFEKFDPGTAI